MSASARRSVYFIERYWLPRMPFCLSSGDLRLIDLLSSLVDEEEDLSRVALAYRMASELGMAPLVTASTT